MTQLSTNSMPSDFSLFDSIINGELRPHLPHNRDSERITALYQQVVMEQILPDEEIQKQVKFNLNNPYYIRYSELKTKQGDTLTFEIDEEKKHITVSTEDSTDVLIDLDVPEPNTITGAYYLFIIEQEYDRLLLKFQNLLLDLAVSPKRYARHSFIILRKLAADAYRYSKELYELGFTDTWNHGPSYSIYVLLVYLERTIHALQELFQPYLKGLLLNAAQIHVLCFGVPNIKLQQEFEKASQKMKTQKKELPKKTLTWKQLFKNPADADEILSILKGEGFIAEDNKWITYPKQLHLVALYLVLNQKGYLKSTPFSAEALSNAFNQQFKMSFRSFKQWQAGWWENAEPYVEVFKLIPPCSHS